MADGIPPDVGPLRCSADLQCCPSLLLSSVVITPALTYYLYNIMTTSTTATGSATTSIATTTLLDTLSDGNARSQ